MRFTRLQFWPGKMKKWYNRPFLCFLNYHEIRTHPGDNNWQICVQCEGEGAKCP